MILGLIKIFKWDLNICDLMFVIIWVVFFFGVYFIVVVLCCINVNGDLCVRGLVWFWNWLCSNILGFIKYFIGKLV